MAGSLFLWGRMFSFDTKREPENNTSRSAGEVSARRKHAKTLRWARGREGCSDSPLPTSGLHPPRNSNDDARRQRRKQGGVVGAAASKTRVPPKARSGCWVPQPVSKGCSPLTILKKKSKHKKASAATVGAIALTLFSLLHLWPLSRCATAPPKGERAPTPSAALSQKAALQMPFSVTTPPVKIAFGALRRARQTRNKNNFSAEYG